MPPVCAAYPWKIKGKPAAMAAMFGDALRHVSHASYDWLRSAIYTQRAHSRLAWPDFRPRADALLGYFRQLLSLQGPCVCRRAQLRCVLRT